MDPAMPQLPAASLELTDEVSDEDALQLRAYRELLFPRNELELDAMGAVQVRLVPGPPDANGNPTQVPVPLAPSMQALNARGSTAFFNRFRPGGSHAGYLTTAELRLLSEWLDIGAQYYNDPFPPTPQN
jgi:hypothetical protein